MTRFINVAVVVVLMFCMLVQAPLVFAEGQYDSKRSRESRRDVTGTDMVADLVFVRPIGFVGLVIGTLAFVVALPFTVPTRQVEEAGEKLVVAPAQYTFVRPLGVKPLGHQKKIQGDREPIDLGKTRRVISEQDALQAQSLGGSNIVG